jgi:hypothetical protein
MADNAYFGDARFGYTRFGVYKPVFENDFLPKLKDANVPSFNDIKQAAINNG